MWNQMEKRAVRVNELLFSIHKILDKLEELDPYGDVIENFQDTDGTKVTTRLMEMIKNDMESEYWKKQSK